MGSCVSKSKVKNPKVQETDLSQIPSHPALPKIAKEETKDETQLGRKNIKKKAPVADNRRRIGPEDVDAATAVITEKPKTDREKEEIREALLTHSLFNSLPRQNVELVIEQMKFYEMGPREFVFEQGQPGNNFFIISAGRVEIIVNGQSKGFLGKGKCFGELALLHDSVRTATIKTIERARLWGIGRQAFRSAVESVNARKYEENKQFLESIPILNLLTEDQKESLLAVMVPMEYSPGQKIVTEGDPGDLMYIIKLGTVSCTFKGNEIRQLGRGEFFGEQALLYDTVRTATVTAITKVKVLSIGRESLQKVLGGELQQLLYRNSQRIALNQSRYLTCLTNGQVEVVIGKMHIASYQDSQVVIHRGNPKKEKIWVVLQGKLTTKGGTKAIEVFGCVGDGDSEITNNLVYESEYVTQGETTIAEITWEELEASIGGPLSSISNHNEVVGILRRVQLLRALPSQKLEAIAAVLRVKEYHDQDAIFRQDDVGDSFYIVKEGQVDIFKDGTLIRTIIKHDFFGERSIIHNENRTATVIAKGSASCWVLDRQAFISLIDEGIRNQLMKRIELQNDSVVLDDLCIVKGLGKGMFGTVYLSVNKKTKTPYALKTVPRTKIQAYEIYDNLILERKILLQIDHPLIMKLVKTLKDADRIYFLIEFVRGKDLFDVLRILNILNNEYSRFYAGCIMLMLEHLHERKIIYRDLKPENIMIDEDGYPKMIDFGTAKFVSNRTYTVVGTPHYMAPEVILGKGYGLAADYWTVGIMIYEFLCGGVPFGEEEEDPYRIYEKVLERRLSYPNFVGQNLKAAPMIELLLNKNPAMRGTYDTIKAHKWFEGLDWDALLGKQIPAPHVPKLESLDTEIARELRNPRDIFAFMKREDGKEVVDTRKLRSRTPPPHWDDEF
ncbi:unnamed protein product [Blepharisma stoltei]|uniref:cGMP-dependent protein kinase n=1 Tax=Blepharisma stoltei TaxID=1481888 RepID=A0AAU9J648_9CILI|nr:unnamed protein product [Blepharisma stoltei]